MRSLKLSFLSLSLVAGLSATATAQQVTFEDAGTSYGFLSSAYAGYNWDNAFVMNPYAVHAIISGGLGNVVSGSHIVVNGGGHTMSVSGATFSLLGGDFAAAWTNGLNLNVKGYSAGNLLYNQNYNLDWGSAQHLALNMFGVDNVAFSSSGGTLDQTFPLGSNQGFAADNFQFSNTAAVQTSVVPEPMTVSLMAAGLLVLGGVQARRRRAARAC